MLLSNFSVYCKNRKEEFPKGRISLDSVSTQHWHFLIFSSFLGSLSVKSFEKSWCNSYTISFLLDVNYHFTCDEFKLFKNLAKFQNITSRIVGYIMWKPNNLIFYIRLHPFIWKKKSWKKHKWKQMLYFRRNIRINHCPGHLPLTFILILTFINENLLSLRLTGVENLK